MIEKFFTEKENSIWLNPDIFFSKKIITDKIYAQSFSIASALKLFNQTHLQQVLTPEIILSNIKISNGENYNGLPWVMCDYPSQFSQQRTFAFRIFYWWGTQINCFLLLQGQALEKYLPVIRQNIWQKKFQNILFAVHENAWQHQIESDSFVSIKNLNEEKIQQHLANHHYIKLSATIAATEFEQLPEWVNMNWKLFSELLN